MTDTIELERVTITQNYGPTVRFTGRLLAETAYETHGGRESLRWVLEVWETAGGSLIAVTRQNLADGDGFEDVRVAVVEPQEDVQAMHFAVMDHFQWHNRARSMARKQLKWKITKDVA